MSKNILESIPFRSMNFPVYKDQLDRFDSAQDLQEYYSQGGLNGLELIYCNEPLTDKIHKDMINGVHLFFHLFWMDFWKGNTQWLDQEFDSRQQWVDYYAGEGREAYLKILKNDLDRAKSDGAKYVVFHVSEVSLAECFSFQCKYTDEEVIDAAAQVINSVLDDGHYDFDFLMENLWWTGLNLKNAELTKRLLDQVHYEKKGIMLDTGHFLNTNPELKSGKEACACLLAMYQAHEELGLGQYFKGMHLQYSLSGKYVLSREWEHRPEIRAFGSQPFYERYRLTYEHAQKIDWHQPFLHEDIRKVIDTIKPTYVTFELNQKSREEYLRSIISQRMVLEKDLQDGDNNEL